MARCLWVLFPGAGVPGRGGGSCSRAQHSSLHWHESPVASVCRWGAEEGDEGALGVARGAGAASSPARRPQVLAPTFWPQSRWRAGE